MQHRPVVVDQDEKTSITLYDMSPLWKTNISVKLKGKLQPPQVSESSQMWAINNFGPIPKSYLFTYPIWRVVNGMFHNSHPSAMSNCSHSVSNCPSPSNDITGWLVQISDWSNQKNESIVQRNFIQHHYIEQSVKNQWITQCSFNCHN